MLLLTPEALRASYEYLRSTKPFNGWNLPAAEEVEMKVVSISDIAGDHSTYRRQHWKKYGRHIIRISDKTVSSTDRLLRTMAHEMIHVGQEECGTATKGEHNKDFYKRLQAVAHIHGFDSKWF